MTEASTIERPKVSVEASDTASHLRHDTLIDVVASVGSAMIGLYAGKKAIQSHNEGHHGNALFLSAATVLAGTNAAVLGKDAVGAMSLANKYAQTAARFVARNN